MMATADPTPSQWNPLPRMRTHEQVIAEIENRLKHGQLNAGDRLPPERTLAESLGVSRNAVREALRILEAIGVIEAGTGSGPSAGSVIVHNGSAGMAMVLRLHLQLASFSAEDIAEVEGSLAELTARKAAEKATVEGIAALRLLVARMRVAADFADYRVLDCQFFDVVAGISGNRLATTIFDGLVRAAYHGAGANCRAPDHMATLKALVEGRATLAEAIASGDGERAARILAGLKQPSSELSDLPRAG
jgi:GntR family transcriptional regulator, transcriptional repressor for pyruvate dehydrogenase complex